MTTHEPQITDYSHTKPQPCPDCAHEVVHNGEVGCQALVSVDHVPVQGMIYPAEPCPCTRSDVNTIEPQGYEHNTRQYRHHGHCSCGWEGWFPSREAAQLGLDGHEAVMETILNPPS